MKRCKILGLGLKMEGHRCWGLVARSFQLFSRFSSLASLGQGRTSKAAWCFLERSQLPLRGFRV